MDCPNHGTADRGAQGMTGLAERSDCQRKTALTDNDFAGLDFDCFGTQIGGEAVLLILKEHDADDPGEMKTAQWDIRDGEHQCAIREAALGPCVFFGKGIPAVAFDIAHGIMKYIRLAIDEKRAIHCMEHAVNTVPALHEGNIPKRAHNVIFQLCECPKPNRSGGMEVRRVDIQRDTIPIKTIPVDTNLIALFLKSSVGELDMIGLCVRDQLYGAVSGRFGLMDRWDHRKCLLF